MSNESLEKNRKNLMRCLSIYNNSVDLEFDLRLAKKDKEADELAEKNDELEEDIRRLRGKMLDDWTTQVSNLDSDLAKMNEIVQAAIDDIKGDIESANKFVALIAHLDTILGLLARIGLKSP